MEASRMRSKFCMETFFKSFTKVDELNEGDVPKDKSLNKNKNEGQLERFEILFQLIDFRCQKVWQITGVKKEKYLKKLWLQ